MRHRPSAILCLPAPPALLALPALLVLLALLALLASISAPVQAATVVSAGAGNDYESWIERLHDGRLLVIFDRNPDWASGDLYATFSVDDGESWSSPAPIIVRNGDQATLSFVQMPSDTLRLFFASNETGYYKIRSAWSLDGLAWVDEGIVELGWGASQQYYDPTVELEPDGSLTMSYVAMSSGVYVAHCPAGGTWDTARTQVSSSGYRPRIIRRSNGHYLYAYHMRVGTSTQYDVFVRSSSDLLNWSAPVRVTSNLNSHDPFPCELNDRTILLTYAKHTGSAYNLYRRTSPDGISWSEELAITSDATNNTQPHLLLDGTRLLLVYAHAVSYPSDHDVYLDLLGDPSSVGEEGRHAFDEGSLFPGSGRPVPALRLTAHPNPCRGAATLRYRLDAAETVTIEFFDPLGRRLARCAPGLQPPGEHSIRLDLRDLPSGPGFCRLQAGRSVATCPFVRIE